MENKFYKMFICFALILTFSCFTAAVALAAMDDDGKDEGLTFKVDDKPIVVKIGGRVFGDWMWGSTDDDVESAFGPLISGNEWRAAWFEVSGSYSNNIDFHVWYDVSGGTATAKDVWMGLKGLPFGAIRIGHQKEPFSLEQLMSNKQTVFMERSLINMFVPSRNTGFLATGMTAKNNVQWAFGVFTDADGQGEAVAHDDTYNFSARITGIPWNSEKNLLHVGAGYHYRDIQEGNNYRFRERPEAHLAYRMVDTSSFAADSINMFNAEFLTIMSSFSLQGEYIGAFVDSTTDVDPNFYGFYVLGSYVITGESRTYKKSSGTPGSPKPNGQFNVDGGIGAWEIAIRYSHLDLDDETITGGVLKDFTLGVNWYMNNYTRIMWNYIYADREDVGTANIFQMRFQFSF